MRVKWGNHESISRRPNKALNIVEDRPALHISIVPTPTWYWSAFGWGDGYRHCPELLSDLSRRLDESASQGVMAFGQCGWRGLRPLASASHRFSPIRGRRRRVNLPGAGDVARSVARQP
jgi:hypothetical protein